MTKIKERNINCQEGFCSSKTIREDNVGSENILVLASSDLFLSFSWRSGRGLLVIVCLELMLKEALGWIMLKVCSCMIERQAYALKSFCVLQIYSIV